MSGEISGKCLWTYVGGVVLFSFGAGWAFGPPGLLMAVGATLVIGAFGEFLLTKIAALSRPSTPARGEKES